MASLKPDKTKGVAAKKRAVKRIDEASATKVPTTRSRTAAIKKMATKTKTITSKTENVVKSIPITKGAAAKKVATKPRVKKEDIKIPANKRPQKPTEFAVKLPNNMSIRAREKALVLLHIMEQDYKIPAQRLAYVSSFVFIVFGSFLAMSFAVILPNDQQSASISGTINSIGGTVDTATNTIAPIVTPIFTSNETLPAILTSDHPYTFTVQYGKNVSARLYSFSDGNKISLKIDTVYTDSYRTYIEVGNLNAGEYKLELIAESIQDGSKSFHTVGRFVVEKGATLIDNSGSSSNTDTSAQQSDPATVDDTTTTNTTTTETQVDNTTSSSTDIIETAVTEITKPRLIFSDDTFSKQELVKVETPKNTRVVEMYIRPLRSIQSRFLGSAVEGSTQWYYFFDTLQVPNGEYELYARTRSDAATFLTSDSRRIKIANAVALNETTTPAVIEESVAPETDTTASPSGTTAIETTPITDVDTSVPPVTSPLRSFSEIPEDELAPADSTIEAEGVFEEVNYALTDYQTELMELLKRYSVAQQSGDPMMIDIAKREFIESKERLITDVLNNEENNYLADDLDQALTERFDSLQKRVETFEQLRRSANTETTGLDTDNDGISDFDEKHLYHTNLEQADTDNDGVIDGVEIMRGFDPLSAEAEAVIEYEMPQETIALVQEDVLKVDTIVPIIQTDTDGTDLPVFAEIRGKALPNSFVTLYVFSTPTIVTVRTDNDGSFVYTFDKELEDGAHEVYVAVTDNTGAIMARSNPFRFVKEAQAFTPVDTAGSDVVSSETLTEFTTTNSYNIAVGLGILAFGIILLMLGISLREKDGVVLKKPEHDLKTT